MGKIKIFSIHDNNLGIIPAGKLLFDEKQQLHVPPTFDPWVMPLSKTVGDFTFWLKTFAETFAEPKLRSKYLLKSKKWSDFAERKHGDYTALYVRIV